MNTVNCWMQKEQNRANMIIIIYFLEHIIMITGLKMKNQLKQQEKVIKKNLSDIPPLDGDKEEVKKGKK